MFTIEKVTLSAIALKTSYYEESCLNAAFLSLMILMIAFFNVGISFLTVSINILNLRFRSCVLLDF